MEWFAPSYPVRQTVLVSTRTEKTFRGILWKRTREYLVLRNVELVKTHAEVLPMPGELVIDRANVDFIQVVAVGIPT